MIYRCPICRANFPSSEVHVERNTGGAFNCPQCHAKVRFSTRYRRSIVLVSLAMSLTAVYVAGVKNPIVLAVGAVVLLLPVALVLQFVFERFRTPSLEEWKPRLKRPYRSLTQTKSDPFEDNSDLFGRRK